MSWGRFRPKSKYGAKKVERAGHSFGSGLEAALFDLLKLRERAGEIKNLTTQDTVYLSKARIMYKPDFVYDDVITGQTEWAEAKGFETSDWRIKRRLWIAYGPGVLHVYKGSKRNLILHESLKGAGIEENAVDPKRSGADEGKAKRRSKRTLDRPQGDA